MSKKHSSTAIRITFVFLLQTVLSIALFALAFNYHDAFNNTFGELLRIPALLILAAYIFRKIVWLATHFTT